MEGSQQDDRWIVVVPKRKRKMIEKQNKEGLMARAQIAGKQRLSTQQEYISQDFEASRQVADNIQRIMSKITTIHKQGSVSLVGLGIGNFEEHLKPHIQFWFMKKIINQLESSGIAHTLQAYDPVFSPSEVETLKTLGAQVQPLEELKPGLVIAYMPHCQRFLHQQLCELRLKSQSSIIVIGNSLKTYKQRCKLLGQKVPYSLEAFSPEEIKICDFKEAFNDTWLYIL